MKRPTHFTTVDVEQHAFDAFFYDAAFVVCHAACAVGAHLSFAVLHHHCAIAIVEIGDGEGRFVQTIEEHLFRIAIVLKCLVIIQVVAGEIGENPSHKLETTNAVLVDGV